MTTPLDEWQVEFGGLLLGSGTAYDIVGIVGLGDQPDVRVADQDRFRDHGMYSGDDFLTGRVIELDLSVRGNGAFGSLSLLLQNLNVIFQPGLTGLKPLRACIPGVANGETIRVMAKTRKRSVANDWLYSVGPLAMPIIQLLVPDPRLYSDEPDSVTTDGGVGQVTVNNRGTFQTLPVITITGPVTNPKVVFGGLEFSLLYDLPAGQTIVLDFMEHTILLGGVENIYYTWVPGSSWFPIDTGSADMQFHTMSGSASSEASMNVTYSSAWAG
jgi:hypothetical protein